MAGTLSYVDIGATQIIESGSATARTSYVDIGAAQRQDVTEPAIKGQFYDQKFLPPIQQRMT